MKMKILSRLWAACKGADAKPAPGWIMQQAQWDPKRKLYIVGNLTNPAQLTVDSGPIPANWYQCFYYYEEKNALPSGGVSFRRCRNLAGPGLKPCFCILHAEEASKLMTTPLKPPPDNGRKYYCRHGSCMVRINKDDEYCQNHKLLYTSADTVSEEDCGCYGYCEKHFNKGQPRTPEQIEWDNIQEDVDWNYCSKIGWGELRYRRNRKSIPVQAQETVHFKLELRGQRDAIDLFHAIVHLCDSDYPLDPFRRNTEHPPTCTNCGGYIWTNAIVTPVDIKKAARQAGITVKVRHYYPESTCKKKDRAATA